MGETHGHGHSHSHAHGASVTRLSIALVISVVVFVVQIWGSIATGSLALLGDTAHLAVDSSGLIIALITARLLLKPATDRHSWGLQRLDVISAFVQAAILIVVGGFLIIGAIRNLFDPPQISGHLLLIFGVVGLVGNIVSLVVLVGDSSRSMNMRAAILDMAADSIGSLAVIASAVSEFVWGFGSGDAIAAVLIALLIIPRAIKLLRESSSILLEATPHELDSRDVYEHLHRKEFVESVHDLHITQVSSELPVITVHVVLRTDTFDSQTYANMLSELQQCVMGHFPVSIEHSTFQIETEDSHCTLQNGH